MGNTAVDYNTAKTTCAQAGGHLPYFTSNSEISAYNAQLSRTEWLGIEKQNGNWVDLTGALVTTFVWDMGEPNNGGGNENCVETDSWGFWNDVDCASLKLFSCYFESVVALHDDCS